MSRGRLATLVLVLLALGGALALSLTGGADPARTPAAADPRDLLKAQLELGELQAQAVLDPCPAGLGLALAVTLPCLGGGDPVDLAAPGTGRPTLVNVYGSWCAPCADEMPLLKAFRDRAGTKVALLGVNTQDVPTSALNFALDFEQHWPAVVDDDGVVLRKYGRGAPLTLFVDATGKVAFVQQGAFRSAEQLDALVAQHLKVTV